MLSNTFIVYIVVSISFYLFSDNFRIPGELKYNLILINKDRLDAAGLSVPSIDWTWEDYRSYAKRCQSIEHELPGTVL